MPPISNCPKGESWSQDCLGSRPVGGPYSHVTSPEGSPTLPSLAWAGGGYGLAFQTFSRAPQTEIWVTRLDATGNVVGEERQLVNDAADSRAPELVWSGSGFGLLWRDVDHGVAELKFTNLDPTMGDLTEDAELVSGEDYAAHQPLAWADGEYGVAWTHYRDLPWPEDWDGRIRFGRVACGCLAGADPDGDGIGMPCDNCPDDANTDQSDVDRDGIGG